MDFSKIKCIIWDLDETLWKGTLLEDSNVILNKTKELLEKTTYCGIINSICSKNDYDLAQEKLVEMGVWDYFVFVSINYEAKGNRIKSQIERMGLRAENILFIDDEIFNLKEAEYCNPGIMISQPYIVAELTRYFTILSEGKRCESRLEAYRLLENKNSERDNFESSDDFLRQSNIVVEVCGDCESQLPRIFDLNQRSNQLNFTKNRCDIDTLRKHILEADNAGYVKAQDKYGKYGIVGFFCVLNGELKHFCFSCRIMNMGIEQYIYRLISSPKIVIVGQVASELDGLDVNWISEAKNDSNPIFSNESKLNILLKGSCDFRRMQLHLPSNIEYEVPYMFDNKNIVYQTGIPTMAMTLQYDINEIKEFADQTPFFNELYYKTEMFENEYDIVFLSLISMGNLGVYRHKKHDFYLSMGLPTEPMYLKEFEEKYRTSGIYANGFNNQKNSFEYLRKNFNYLEDYIEGDFSKHLDMILEHIKAKKICLILGNEEKHSREKSLSGRTFERINRIVLSKVYKQNVEIINISDYIKDKYDIVNHFNHFSSKVYYELALTFNKIISEMELKNCGKDSLFRGV